MVEYTTIGIDYATKEEFDKQRKTEMGEISANDFLMYLLKKNSKK